MRWHRPHRQALYYALAILLPPVCSVLSTHIVSLHAFPTVLDLFVILVVATLGGLGPGLCAVGLAILSRLIQGSYFAPPISRTDIVRCCVLLLEGLILGFLTQRRRSSDQKLDVAIADLQDRTEALSESLAAGRCASWILDLEKSVKTFWYPGSYPIFGRPFTEINALPTMYSVVHPEELPRLAELEHRLQVEWEPIVWEFRVPWPNGDLHWLEMRATRVLGKPCVWRGITVDITERKLTDAALIRSEKLAAMGRIASTVAHEINNPLEAVTNLLYLVNSEPDLPEAARSYLALAERELARLGHITRLTLGFVRNSGNPVNLDLGASLEDVLFIFQHRLDAKQVSLTRHIEPGVLAHIASHEFRQIATNLIANAADALAGTDCLVAVTVRRSAGRAVLLVEDNGSGIDAAHLDRIFEPFFSTKADTGTGIGLWVTRELVEKYGGSISVESGNLPGGMKTRFCIDFPLAAESSSPTIASTSAQQPAALS